MLFGGCRRNNGQHEEQGQGGDPAHYKAVTAGQDEGLRSAGLTEEMTGARCLSDESQAEERHAHFHFPLCKCQRIPRHSFPTEGASFTYDTDQTHRKNLSPRTAPRQRSGCQRRQRKAETPGSQEADSWGVRGSHKCPGCTAPATPTISIQGRADRVTCKRHVLVTHSLPTGPRFPSHLSRTAQRSPKTGRKKG